MFLHRVKIFTLAGFSVWIDVSWLIFAALVTWTFAADIFPALVPHLAPATYWAMGASMAIGLFLSIVLHELSHSLMARRFSIRISGITLFIFGGVAQLEAEPSGARAEFLMAVVGPICSIVLGTLLLIAAALLPGTVPAAAVFAQLGTINWGLALFNLVPAYPLDGGRMLRAALWSWKKDLVQATQIASAIGQSFGVTLILLGVLVWLRGDIASGIWLFLIGLFLHGAAGSSRQQTLLHHALSGRRVAAIMNADPVAVRRDLPLASLVEDYFYRFHHRMFPVLNPDGTLAGLITARQLRKVSRERWQATSVGDVMEKSSPRNTVAPTDDAFAALVKMGRERTNHLLVAEEGALRGILSLSDLLQFLSLMQELDHAAVRP